MDPNNNISQAHAVETSREADLDITEVARALSRELPSIATELIKGREDSAEPINQTFAENPDDIHEHEPLWHQFGIVTHALRAESAYQHEIPTLLKQWGIEETAIRTMSQEIDGITKDDLMKIALLLHDVGKFTKRRLEEGRGRFKGHETDSGTIIRQKGSVVNEWLTVRGFTDAQIDYIAECAALHFELGKMREAAKDSKLGYTLAFIESPRFHEMTQAIMHEHPKFALEIGILFLADNLSKVDLRLEDTSSDAALSSQQSAIEGELTKQSLPLSLVGGVLQLPVNAAVAERYLKIWAETSIQERPIE